MQFVRIAMFYSCEWIGCSPHIYFVVGPTVDASYNHQIERCK
jgi:hypothetical protein